jgi:hypothetical protein
MLPDWWSEDTTLVVYDLGNPQALEQARAHRALWGRRFTDVYSVGLNHVVLAFRPGPERWRVWERRRLRLILDEGGTT